MIDNVTNYTKFLRWKEITNEIISSVGDITTLTTDDKSNLVNAINEVFADLGNIDLLTTTDKSNAVNAIIEIVADIGDMTLLKTTTKTIIVGAINEVFDNVGPLETLTTTNKTSCVNAINELDGEIGDLTTLSTDEKGTLVGATNEVFGNVGDLSTLTTDDTGSIVGAVNEVDANVGDLTALTTTAQDDLVDAINEVDADVATRVLTSDFDTYKPTIQSVNNEPQIGRFSIATKNSVAVTTFNTDDTVIQEFNSSSIAEGDQFINDNADNGGLGASMGADIQQLLSAMLRVSPRYGYEYFIAEITGGTGTTNTITVSTIDYNPQTTNGNKFITRIDQWVTWVGWIKLTTLNNAGDLGIIVGDADSTVYIDGTDVGASPLITVADGWKHVRVTKQLTDSEFDENFPMIAGNVSDVIQVACSGIYNGFVDVGLHKGVI
ncbi:MAG TPA: hypothetical protein ENK70_01135 [Methylophaga sp.]|nr:hypothetical protein [Methylophaga sp.]